MISFENPFVLYLLLLMPPAVAFAAFRFVRFKALLGGGANRGKSRAPFAQNAGRDSKLTELRRRFSLRAIFWALGWCFLVVAAAGPSWGSKAVAVQKNGNAVSFVFDISYSMTAQDMPKGKTRLYAAALYAQQLLGRMQGCSVSAVLAKGSGVLAVPLTEDFTVLRSLLENLSPRLLSSPGTDLAAGISCAVRSFPANSARAASIVVFTDGDETLSSMKSAMQEACDYGMTLVLVGFGDERETEVLTGDGERSAKTALRQAKLEELCAGFAKNAVRYNGAESSPKVLYVNSQDAASALKVLDAVLVADGKNMGETLTVYESQSVPRFPFFAALALICLVCGFLANEIRRPKKALRAAAALLLSLPLFSCSQRASLAKDVLEGVIYWGQDNYTKASAAFLGAEERAALLEDPHSASYAVYGLATTYLMQNEGAAALKRFEQIPPDASAFLQFASHYNSGIICYQNGDYEKAAESFKRALLVDSTNLNAKINLELAMGQISVQSPSSSAPLGQASQSESSAVQDAIFSIMRENEQNQWKSQKQEKSDILDY